jgi:hypothetical protein
MGVVLDITVSGLYGTVQCSTKQGAQQVAPGSPLWQYGTVEYSSAVQDGGRHQWSYDRQAMDAFFTLQYGTNQYSWVQRSTA